MVHRRPRKAARPVRHRNGHVAPESVERRVFVASVAPKGDVTNCDAKPAKGNHLRHLPCPRSVNLV